MRFIIAIIIGLLVLSRVVKTPASSTSGDGSGGATTRDNSFLDFLRRPQFAPDVYTHPVLHGGGYGFNYPFGGAHGYRSWAAPVFSVTIQR